MWILVVIGIFFAIVIIRAYLNSNYKSYKDAEKNIANSKSEILVEKISEIDGKFLIEFNYKIANERFPVEKISIAESEKEAHRILESFKNEYRQRTQNLSQNEAIINMESTNSNIDKNNKWYSEIISFEFKNGYWWLGLALTSSFLLLGCLGFLFIRNADEKDKKAYASGVWKGCVLYMIIKSLSQYGVINL